MSDPAHYATSDYYQPGIMQAVGMMTFGIILVLAFFIIAVIGSRRMLRKSRRLSRPSRKLLQFLGGLAKPASPISFGKRQHKLGRRRKDEGHYKMSAASDEAEGAWSLSADSASIRAGERPFPKRRLTIDLALSPEEMWPQYSEEEIAAVVDILRSGKVNQWTGSKVFEFERAYTRHLRNGRAIALANGTVALELALRAFNVGPGDEVIVTPRSFVASASCVRLVGATPVFADVDRNSGNVTAETIQAVITPRTKAIIPVHLGGWPADMPAIMSLAQSRGISVIEDCAQAHGAEIDGLPVGSFGDAATFSFCQDKIISTGGEGGLVTFRDGDTYEWAWSFKDHGKDRHRALEPSDRQGFRWLHDNIGTNWRMTEIAAAIGLLQMEKMPQWQARRQRNAESWAEALSPIPGLRVPMPPQNVTGAFYKFYAYLDVDRQENGKLRDEILERVSSAGLRLFSGSCSEIYREAAFRDMSVDPLPVARELGESSLMFEVHPTLDSRRLRDRADEVASIIQDVLR